MTPRFSFNAAYASYLDHPNKSLLDFEDMAKMANDLVAENQRLCQLRDDLARHLHSLVLILDGYRMSPLADKTVEESKELVAIVFKTQAKKEDSTE